MEDNFKIYIDRLREGRVEEMAFTSTADFIGVPEEFSTPVKVMGEAYLAHEHLIMRLTIETKASYGCAICSELIEVDIIIKELYQTVELAKIAHFVFNFEDLVRDAILLQVPHAVECNEGDCPNREMISKYFRRSRDYGGTKK